MTKNEEFFDVSGGDFYNADAGVAATSKTSKLSKISNSVKSVKDSGILDSLGGLVGSLKKKPATTAPDPTVVQMDPTQPTTTKDNTLMYAGIGAGALVAGIAIYLLVFKKKKS